MLMDDETLQGFLEAHVPVLGPQQHKWIPDAMAVAAYHTALEFPVVRLLVCDDAPQFTLVTQELGLCWVHDRCHDKKLMPSIAHHRSLLDNFLDQYWGDYAELLAHQKAPTSQEARRLDGEFETLFSTVTGYEALDARIAKMRAKKSCLLMVLRHPEISLYNNLVEFGARPRVHV